MIASNAQPQAAPAPRFSPEEAAAQIDAQARDLLQAIRGQRVALLTNPTGVDGRLSQLADLLVADRETTVVAFFAPEHGLRGDQQAGAQIQDYIDPFTGVPVSSVYGSRKAPAPEQLAGVDALIFDIQDTGARFYTYVWTMTYAMEAAAQHGVKFIVFDRPNPVGGRHVEGPPNRRDGGLVGRLMPGAEFGVATRHGMTAGEFASLVNGEWMNPRVNLQVIPMRGWTRDQWFDDTGRFWTPPSPNMPSLDTATVYTGTCLFEGTNLSEGRGTTRPFETFGAPFVNGVELARRLNALDLPGARFRAVYFTPTFSKFAGERCGGAQLHVSDREKFEPVRTGLYILKTLCEMYPGEVQFRSFAETLTGIYGLETRIRTQSVEEIIASWQADLEAFRALRAKYLIYPEAPPARSGAPR